MRRFRTAKVYMKLAPLNSHSFA